MTIHPKFLTTLAFVALVAGCGNLQRHSVADVPVAGRVAAKQQTEVTPTIAPADVVRHVSAPRLRDLEGTTNDVLPATEVGPFAAADMELSAVLDAISYDSGVAFAYGGEDMSDRKISMVDPNQIPFSAAVSRIARAGDLFYSYEDGVLSFAETHRFAVEVPEVAGVAEALKSGLDSVGAENVTVSSASGGLTLEASPAVARRVRGLLEEWSENRSVIVYDSYIYEVTRSRSGEAGIGIETIKSKLQTIANAKITDEGDNALTTSSSLAIDALLSELTRNSNSRVLSQPTLSVVSGSSASIDVGSKQQYVSSTSSTTNDGTTSSDIEVDEISSGLQMEVNGQLSGDIITTELDLELSTLLGFEEFSSGEGTLKLPNTNQRSIQQTLMARPGDTLVLAGLMTSSVSEQRSGLRDKASRWSQESSVEELIVVLRPRVIRFQ